MKQTAVQWLIEQLADLTFNYIAGFSTKEEYDALSNQVIEQAKKLEKQQIENAFRIGATTELTFGDNKAEKYYNKEYGGEL